MPPSPPALTTTGYAILGLLSLRDWTTYELAQQMQRTLGFVWPRAERKIYDEPKRLAEAGYATATADAVGRRPRTTYAITDAGRDALAAWLTTAPEPSALEFEGILRVLFADQGDLASLRASLATVLEQAIEARLRIAVMGAEIAGSDGAAFPARMHVNALGFRFLIDHYDAMIAWAEWALAETKTWRDTTTPAKSWRPKARAVFERAAEGAPFAGTDA